MEVGDRSASTSPAVSAKNGGADPIANALGLPLVSLLIKLLSRLVSLLIDILPPALHTQAIFLRSMAFVNNLMVLEVLSN